MCHKTLHFVEFEVFLMKTRFGTFAGQSYVKKLNGGIGTPGKKGRSRFDLTVTNVATEVNSVEQVWFFLASSL